MSGDHGRADAAAKPAAGGPDDGAGWSWSKVADTAVIASVVVIGVIAVEWFVGYYVRERIARGADQYLARANAGGGDQASPE